VEHLAGALSFPKRRFVTLIIDLTPTHDQTGPARLLDLVAGRSDRTGRLAGRPTRRLLPSRGGHPDGRVRGYKTVATQVIPDAVTVMDPFYAEVRIMPMWRALVLVMAVTTPVRSA
jgi:hypothetical protein